MPHETTNPEQEANAGDRPVRIVLDDRRMSLDGLDSAWGHAVRVEITDETWKRIEAGHESVRRIVAGDQTAYGINTGFGPLCTKRISTDQLETLQRNLIMSHAVGVGDPVPPEIVRWIMLLKLRGLCHGVSGISRATLSCLADLLNADVLPVIPTQGSLGASGDLAPLAHMVLPMIGLGTVTANGRVEPAAKALKRAGIHPVTLGPKEGLALINGTQFMAAYASAIAVRARRLVKHVDVVATMSLEGMMGSIGPFHEKLHQLRPYVGAMQSAQNVRRMMAGSEILASHADCTRVQDPYSIRCVPQVHGATRDALRHAIDIIETEINAVTDNPLIVDGEVLSGGLFHGQSLALVLDYLAMALSELASISERRTYLLLTGENPGAPGRGGVAELPLLLMKDTGLNSGFMLPQYTAAALVSENKGLCTPACVDSIPTALGQEDHVSMGARSAVKCYQILKNVETVLAIEQMCAAQAIDYRAPLSPGVGPRTAHAEFRKDVSHAEADRLIGEDISKSLALLRSQRIVRSVENEIGPLA
ncbi:MAG: histidine ammonia-lyase [Planctomycetes bacterium]|nr:histidine ammonia-lyase [Planctomycetota bacterium]